MSIAAARKGTHEAKAIPVAGSTDHPQRLQRPTTDPAVSPSPPSGNTTGIRVIGNQVQVTLSGIGTPQLSTSAQQLRQPTVKLLALSASSFSLATGGATVTARSSTDIVPLGGTRSSSYRYVSATVSFTNTGTVPLTNLTFASKEH